MPKRLDSISRQTKADPAHTDAAKEEKPADTVAASTDPVATPMAENTPPVEVIPATEEAAPKTETPASEPAPTTPSQPSQPIPDAAATEQPVEVKKAADTNTTATPSTEPSAPASDPAVAIAAAVDLTPAANAEAGDATKADSFASLFPEPSVVMSGPPGWVWWILLILGAAGLGFLAFSLTRSQIDNWLSINPSPSPVVSASTKVSPTPTKSTTTSPTPSPSSSATVTPTPSSIAKSSITMRVLNGTTVAGQAGAMKTKLENAGFTVRTIGNANNQNYAETTIYYETGHLAEAQTVQTALGSLPTILQESSVASPDMVLVVVGLKK